MVLLLFDILKKKINYVKQSKVISDIYYLKARLPTVKELKNFNDFDKNSLEYQKYIANGNYEKFIRYLKKEISRIDDKIPLYDLVTKNMYIVDRENIYNRVIYQYYRFPDENLLKQLEKKKNIMSTLVENLVENNNDVASRDPSGISTLVPKKNMEYDKLQKCILTKRELRKLNLMLQFMDNYNLDVLEKTYVTTFYYYSNEVGKNISICEKPSFDPEYKHTKPYYTRSELVNLALNMKIMTIENNDELNKSVDDNDKNTETKILKSICKKVKENDISSDVIKKHEIHIIDNKMIGLIQYYSLQGSFFINSYMRFLMPGLELYKDIDNEKNIQKVWELIRTSPKFDKNYTVYRFISEDKHLINLNVGDIYEDFGFMSTTRDPFYRSDTYEFGFILMKINLPKDATGSGLCVESMSMFPEEQEIILPPFCKLKLINKDENTLYYHTDKGFTSLLKRKYEFVMLENLNYDHHTLINEVKQIKKRKVVNLEKVEFSKLKSHESLTISEKIQYFVLEFTLPLNKCKANIGDKEYIIKCEWYDSTSAYQKYYSMVTDDGFSLYSIEDGHMMFFMEIGKKINDESYIDVNYYMKYSTFGDNIHIPDDDLLQFVSDVANYFGIKNAIIYSNYKSYTSELTELTNKIGRKKIKKDKDGNELNEPNEKMKKSEGNKSSQNYCVDIYEYLKNGKIRFGNHKSISPFFRYRDLDKLKSMDPTTILSEDDSDEIYQIYNKIYIENFGLSNQNVSDFYIFLVSLNCHYASLLSMKLTKVLKKRNPFLVDYYFFDIGSFKNKKINGKIKVAKTNEVFSQKNMYRNDQKVMRDDRLILRKKM